MSDRFDPTLEHKLKPKPGRTEPDAAVATLRRIEVLAGVGRRRQWSDDDKAQIVVESLIPGAVVSEVARRHGVTPQQLFSWRRAARALFNETTGQAEVTPRPSGTKGQSDTVSAFAPVVLAFDAEPGSTGSGAPPPNGALLAVGTVEIIIGDAVVRVIGDVESAVLAGILRAVRRSS